jgi:hypothetical protein
VKKRLSQNSRFTLTIYAFTFEKISNQIYKLYNFPAQKYFGII